MKLRDGSEREFVLAATHEETVTFHARELRSYRDLPKILYHFQTKERDEQRPRGGLLRVREFVMKDAYSFDRDEDGLDARVPGARAAPTSGSSSAAGSRPSRVQAESGMMGGSESIDYLAPSGSGENTLVTCERGDYAADLEIAHGVPRPPELPGRARRARGGRDAGDRDVRGPRRVPRDRPRRHLEGDAGRRDGQVVLALVRGDDRLDEAKLAAVLGAGSRPAHADEIRAGVRRRARARSGPSGSAGGSCSTRRCATDSSSPVRTAPGSTSAASSTAATSRPRWRTSASRARATRARAAAAHCASRRRSRSVTSSSSARSTRCRSTRPTSTSSRSSGRS